VLQQPPTWAYEVATKLEHSLLTLKVDLFLKAAYTYISRVPGYRKRI